MKHVVPCKGIIFYTIIRPHRSTMYVDVTYCYRPNGMVCRSVCLSVTLVIPAKMAASIEMRFGLRTWVGPGNHVLDGGPDPLMGRPILRWKGASHSKL